MATIDELNAKNIRPATVFRATIYDSNGTLLLTITEAELIRATVSLRSDLSRINPTLPESEIEIEAYFDTDISDVLADAGEELEVRYRWWPETASYGYNRYFFTDERITWQNKILHIHAVDQVRLLDEELPPIYLGQVWCGNTSVSQGYVIRELNEFFLDLRKFKKSGFGATTYYRAINTTPNIEGTFSTIPDGGALNSIIPRMTRREALAKIMNLCHWEFDSGTLSDRNSFWPVYVDAGRPHRSNLKPTGPQLQINIEDCGDFQESKEPVYNEINALVNDVEYSGYKLKESRDVSATEFKQSGIAFSFSGFISDYRVGLAYSWEPINSTLAGMTYETAYQSFDAKERALPISSTIYPSDAAWMQKNKYGMWLLDDKPEINPFSARSHTFLDLSGSKWTDTTLDGFLGSSPADDWNDWISNGVLNAAATDAELNNRSHFFMLVNDRTVQRTKAQQGGPVDFIDDVFWNGSAKLRKYDDSGEVKLLPEKAMDCILDRSNIIGSFTWKGDPRLDPRSVVELKYLDENLADEDGVYLQTEDGDDIVINRSKIITIENITLTHEGGGTISQITYRDGIC